MSALKRFGVLQKLSSGLVGLLVRDPQSTPEPVRIACVGASVTFGRGLANRREECYPAVLQRLLSMALGDDRTQVKNFGYSGGAVSRTSNEPYWDTPSFAAATRYEPNYALLMLGTNDAQFANAAARETLATDWADLIAHFQCSSTVLVAQMPPVFPPLPEIDFAALTDEVRPLIARVAAEQGVSLVDFWTPLKGCSEDFPDGLHPTATVAAQIAQIAYDALLPLLRNGSDTKIVGTLA